MKFWNLALVGDPVEHSRSPVIQKAALASAGLEGDYQAIRADVPRLEEVIGRLRSGDLDGVNVTMPLKLPAWERSDRLTDEARLSGSVNTLRVRDGVLEAHSTDVVAFREIFSLFPEDTPMLLLGSGGSARAALTAWDRGPAFASVRNPATAGWMGQFEVDMAPWGEALEGAVLVNTTPLGMHAEELPDGLLGAAAVLVDLPYGAQQTPAVSDAAATGMRYFDGVEFLARQAAASFTWWTGVDVDWAYLTDVARNT